MSVTSFCIGGGDDSGGVLFASGALYARKASDGRDGDRVSVTSFGIGSGDESDGVLATEREPFSSHGRSGDRVSVDSFGIGGGDTSDGVLMNGHARLSSLVSVN